MKKAVYISTILVVFVLAIYLTLGDIIKESIKFREIVENLEISDEIRNEITLINIGDGDREYIGNLISRVNELSPKVIGVDVFFNKLKNPYKDSILAKAIEESPVVLAIQPSGNFLKSAYKFTKHEKNSGIAEVISSANVATHFYPIRCFNRRDTIENFSLAIVSCYDSVAHQAAKSKLEFNTKYIVPYRYRQSSFKVYDFKDLAFRDSDIRGKIVLLAYLGPTNEDKHISPIQFQKFGKKEFLESSESKKDIYGSVIVANEVLAFVDGIDLKK